MRIGELLTCAVVILVWTTVSSYALGGWIPDGAGRVGGGSHSAPGPVMGVGIPALVALGGYIWHQWRHRRK